MQDLITSFIIQAKECKLPGIGMFRVINTPAEPDIANKQILPPITEILFTGKEEKISDDLVKYVSIKKNVNVSESLADIKEWCTGTKSKLNNGEEIFLQSLGSLKKGPSGNIFFHSKNHIQFFEPVAAERVIHKNSEHAVLVGDKKTTSSAMNEFFHEEKTEQKSNSWKIISIVLLAIAVLLLLFYFYEHSFSLSAIGNQGDISPQSPPATYSPQ